jgi:uncharacterized protein (TIGR00661 family)
LNKINIHRVLIAPLDWGLGHATRCIPIIKALKILNFEVVIAAEGAAAKLLSEEFPEIRIIPLIGYRIEYASTAKGLVWKIFLQIPKILSSIKQEHSWLKKIIENEKIDLVISDNRYGLSTKKIPSIFITHQLHIKTPFKFLEYLIRKINYHFINQFSACWVPDAAGEINVAGQLSHPKTLPAIPVHYLGMISRMQHENKIPHQNDYCFLVSGPEPQRTILEAKIIEILPTLSGSVVIVRGLPSSTTNLKVSDNTKVFNHLSTKELAELISASKLIICRSGYTSVMELIGMKKNALLIPTPGQTEQEYLAKKLSLEGRFLMVNQDEIDLIKILEAREHAFMKGKDIPVFSTNTLEALLQAI